MVFYCYSVESGQVGVVQTCGKFTGIQEPGLAPYLCCICTVRPVSLATNNLRCSSDCKTKDNVTLRVTTTVVYKIDKAKIEEAVFKIMNPEFLIESQVDSVLRSTVPTMDLDEAYAAKEKMVAEIETQVAQEMAIHGYQIMNVLITDLAPDASVLSAMNEINASRRNRAAAIEKGEADKTLIIKKAEAEAESQYQSGLGLARMREAITNGFKDSLESMGTTGLSTDETINMMLVTQYLDTLKDVSQSSTNTISIPHGPNAVTYIEQDLKNGFAVIGSQGMKRK